MKDPVIAQAAAYVAKWVKEQCRMREIVRRPFAIIDGEVVSLNDVLFHDPEAMK